MRKIRDFKLRLSYKEIRRRARKTVHLAGLGLSDELRLESVVSSFAERLRPAVIFDSCGPEAETAELSSMPGLAHTLGLCSLGPDVPAMVEEARTESEERGKLFDLMVRAALEQSVQFVIGLLKDEVEAERCELSPIQYLTDPDALEQVLEKLGGAKIGVGLEAGRLKPEHSAAFCLSWIAKARRSRKSRAKTAPGRKK